MSATLVRTDASPSTSGLTVDISVAGPITTQREVDDDMVLFKVLFKVTLLVGEVGHRKALRMDMC